MKDKIMISLKIVTIILIVIAIAGIIYSAVKAKTEKVQNPVVTFEIENYGNVKMELYPEYAPNTVANFIKLIEAGYYNNKVIYSKDDICVYLGRNTDGTTEEPTLSKINSGIEAGTESDKKYQIAGEFVANGFERNTLRHEKGIVTMIRSDYTSQMPTLAEQSYNSANSQIGVITSDDARDLNGVYAGFGRIIEGLNIVEKIASESQIEEKTEENASDMDVFVTKPVIKNATVDTFGNDYGVPQTVEYFDYQAYMSEILSQYYGTQGNE
jgi:peptidyl-prolyl cis-trans isomerase B (cyclophilin B)